MAKITAIRIKTIKGKPPMLIDRGLLEEGYGLAGDMRGSGDRQVSLLDWGVSGDEVLKGSSGFCVTRFVENITTRGIRLENLAVGSRLRIGEAVLEISFVGKECYDNCPAYHNISCGVAEKIAFARVIKSGMVKVGDEIVVLNEMKG